MTTPEDADAMRLAADKVGGTMGSAFRQLVEWLLELQGRVSRIEAAVKHLDQVVDAIGPVDPDDDSSILARLQAVEDELAQVVSEIDSLFPAPGNPAAQLTITLNDKGAPMPNGAISVDTNDKTASFSWLDDKGEATTVVPTSADGGAVTVTLSCDNPAIATLAADPSLPNTFDITPVAAGGAVESSPGAGDWAPDGSVHIVATAVDDQGAAANFADGQPISAAPVNFGVYPGAAAELSIAVSA